MVEGVEAKIVERKRFAAIECLKGLVVEYDKSRIDAQVQELRQAMTGNDTSRIKNLTESLQQEYARVMQSVAQAQTAPGEPSTGQSTSSPDGDVVDGEFTEQS